MSANISHIQDEDVLRDMWHNTSDFGKKKEIRTRMYKLREERLKNMYNTDESCTKSSSVVVKESSKTSNSHAESLADHSYHSLKSKEVRDSGSPTKDINTGWTVSSTNESSEDGKRFTSSRVATTSGTELLDNGRTNYVGKSEMVATVFKDGDEKNFTKAVGASHKNVIEQEAFGGDENSQFRMTSSSTTSSSKFVQEHKSSGMEDFVPAIEGVKCYSYEDKIPEDLKRHPNYVEGKTKVTTEVKTLPDGTIVRKTRYETKGDQMVSASQSSSEEFKSSKVVESRSEQISSGGDEKIVVVKERDIHPIKNEERFESSSKYINQKKFDDNKQVVSTKDFNDKSLIQKTSDKFQEEHFETKTQQVITGQEEKTVKTIKVTDEVDHSNTNVVNLRKIEDNLVSKQEQNVKTTCDRQDTQDLSHQDHIVKYQKDSDSFQATNDVQTVFTDRKVVQTRQVTENDQLVIDHKQETRDQDHYSSATPIEITNGTTDVTKDKFIENERRHVTETMSKGKSQLIKHPPLDHKPKQPAEVKQSPEEPSPTYEQPERRSPIRPAKSEMDEKTSATEGQYDTTYRSDYTSKRISVDVNPTHDAFARSLRAVSPERVKGSSTSVRMGSPSPRASPEKVPERKRGSGEERSGSPGKRSQGPDDRAGYPGGRASSPGKRYQAPDDRVGSPDKRYQTPDDRSGSPTSRATSLGKIYQAPDHRADSPDTRATSPGKRYQAPDDKLVSPGGRATSPGKKAPSPDKRTTSPVKRYYSPDERATSPVKRYSPEERSVSPDKRSPSPGKRCSPDGSPSKRKSPEKFSSTETITKSTKKTEKIETYNTDTFTRKKTTKKSRSPSPTSTVSDFEYIQTTKEPVTDLDDDVTILRKTSIVTTKTEQRPTSLDVNTTKSKKKLTERSPTSPLPSPKKTASPTKDVPVRRSSLKSPSKEIIKPADKPFKRTDTYEERCRQILGIEKVDTDRRTSSLDRKTIRKYTEANKSKCEEEKIENEFSRYIPRTITDTITLPTYTKSTPITETRVTSTVVEREGKRGGRESSPKITEFPSQKREPSPQKQLFDDDDLTMTTKKFIESQRVQEEKEMKQERSHRESPERTRKTPRESPERCIQEQMRKSPEKDICEYPKKKPEESKKGPTIQEFPSQIRKSPEKDVCEYPKKKPEESKKGPTIQEFPSQIRKSPEKEVCEYPKKKSEEEKKGAGVQEFPSQICKSPEREYSRKPEDIKKGPSIQEFPSQVRKSPEREVCEFPKRKPEESKKGPTIQEFPSQIRKSPEKEVYEYPKKKPEESKKGPTIQEFPSQIRKSPEKEVCEYPKKKPEESKKGPTIQEFPSQIRKSPDKDVCEYPKKKPEEKTGLTIQEFPSQIRKSPEKEVCEYPKKKPEESKKGPTIQEFPSQLRKSPENETYDQPESPKIKQVPSQVKKTSQEKQKPAKKVEEFPSQVRKSPVKEPEEKIKAEKKPCGIQEYPSQVKKKPQVVTKKTPSQEIKPKVKVPSEPVKIKEFPSQVRKKSLTEKQKVVKSQEVKKQVNGVVAPKQSPYNYQNKTPIKEPEFVKKYVAPLGPEDEVLLKKNQTNVHKTVKKDLSRTIEKEAEKRRQTVNKTDVHVALTNGVTKKPTKSVQKSPLKIKDDVIKAPKRHIVTATITVTPKKTVKKALQNGHSNMEEVTKKVITTKSIQINNEDEDEHEVVVKLQRSKSSREPSPDKIYPLPISSDDETGTPRYPDQVCEPDEDFIKRKPKKLSDIPILETEVVEDFVEVNKNGLSVVSDIQERPKSPRCQHVEDVYEDDESSRSVSEKITHFVKTAEKVGKPKKFETFKPTKVDEKGSNVAEKVSKFIETADKITVSVSKIEASSKRPSTSPEKERTPSPRQTHEPDSTPKSSRRPSKDDAKQILGSVSKLRSTESIKKAKALFESIGKKEREEKERERQRDILSRPSVLGSPKKDNECAVKQKLSKETGLKSTRLILEKIENKSPSPERIKLRPQESPESSPNEAKQQSRESSKDRDVPGYMKPLDRTLRPQSPQREKIHKEETEEVDKRVTKFGVTLRRTDSGKTTKTTEVRKKSTGNLIADKEIEDIYDLELLEEMLEKSIGYEIRRRIRSQIRIVKKLQAEGKTKASKKHTKTTSEKSSEFHQYSYSSSETRSSSRSPERKVIQPEATTKDERPDWVTQKNLRQVKETKSVKQEREIKTEVKKEVKGTDAVISSYGVGPLDENGTPLFGLKALRANKKEAVKQEQFSKVQGTVIRSQYRSENGGEPMGEVSITKYSTDPNDLGSEGDVVKGSGVTSVTTTQKFGYKGTPSLKTITGGAKKEICDVDSSTITKKTTRRGSVKEISQKFIENAVETSKKETQSYPKAGLILRTTRRDSKDRESSKESESQETYETSNESETFLTNTTKITGVQDVINRMKNEDVRQEDSAEDAEARMLLNKFIGSQVILSGMEGHLPKAKAVKRTVTKVTMIGSDGESRTVTRTFEHPVSEEELESVWDEQTLRLLLEQSTDYEERRLIRARLRQVMAEQEACADLVEKASQDAPKTPTTPTATGTIEGESLLLPLLQGLLDAPEKEQTADSGTECGDDLRTGLIAEVQGALDKLSASLRSDATDITPERRHNLLQLVTKLQAGLATQPIVDRRRNSGGHGVGRYARRKQRQNRHTVGVSSEELADARRLMEEIAFRDSSVTPSSTTTSLLQKQHSESSVGQMSNGSFRSVNMRKASPIKNATAKPFSNSTSVSHSSTSSSLATPSDPSEFLQFLFAEEQKPQEVYTETAHLQLKRNFSVEAVKQAAVNKLLSGKSQEDTSEDECETDDDSSTVKTVERQVSPNKPDVVLQANPIYSSPEKESSPEEKYNRFNSKKMRMKRANTIDIPKPLNFYQCDDDDEDSDYSPSDRRNSYLALRGPIRVGKLNQDKKVPSFEPKTESDHKFMAFLSKHNESGENKVSSLWAQQQANKVHNWNSRFGNIKTIFETAQEQPASSARNFWKSADDAVTAGTLRQQGPKLSRQSARNLQQMFEQKQKETKLPWTNVQPQPINKFSHAPMSAFKPIPPKTPPADMYLNPIHKPTPLNVTKTDLVANSDSPLFLYSPRNVAFSPPVQSPINNSPLSPQGKPFLPTTNRMVNKAASIFEQVAQEQKKVVFERKPLMQQKSVEQPKVNTVRKLSGQFDGVGKEESSVRKLGQMFKVAGNQAPTVPVQKRIEHWDKQTKVVNRPTSLYQNKVQDEYDDDIVRKPSKKIFKAQPHHYVPPLHNHPQQFIQPVVTKPQIVKTKEVKEEKQYVSSFTYKPKAASPVVNYGRQNSKDLNRQMSSESYKEYSAAVARVMTGPVSQQAVTVRQKSPMSREEHDMERAFDLRSALQRSSQQKTLSTGSFKTKYELQKDSRTPSPNTRGIIQNGQGDSVVTGKFHIPVVNVQEASVLSKSDSWHQVCQMGQMPPKPAPSARSVVKSKSSHTLAVPKLFEAGMTKEEMAKKKRTMEAFFTEGSKSPELQPKTTINRVKTSQKISIQSSGLSRSRTLPDIVCPDMLDESNVDKAFEDLFRSNM